MIGLAKMAKRAALGRGPTDMHEEVEVQEVEVVEARSAVGWWCGC